MSAYKYFERKKNVLRSIDPLIKTLTLLSVINVKKYSCYFRKLTISVFIHMGSGGRATIVLATIHCYMLLYESKMLF